MRRPRSDEEVLRLAIEDLRSLMMDHVVPWFERMPTLADAAAFREHDLESAEAVLPSCWVELGAIWYRAGNVLKAEECWGRAPEGKDKDKSLARVRAVLGLG